jgi:hypothetical protein
LHSKCTKIVCFIKEGKENAKKAERRMAGRKKTKNSKE